MIPADLFLEEISMIPWAGKKAGGEEKKIKDKFSKNKINFSTFQTELEHLKMLRKK